MASSFLVRSTLPRAIAQRSVLRSAAFQARHSTSDAASVNARYIPGGPVYKGTVNDPTTFPTPSRSHGSHHWAFERLLSAGLVPITAAAFVTSGSNYPIVDGLLGISLIVHSHIGFDALLVDYVHKRKFPILGPLSSWALRATTVGVLVGVYQFNTNDIGVLFPALYSQTLIVSFSGLTELIAKVWTA
ncbi:hypothetical protein DXG03_008185 [Asterophora parasitica]|uniref:Succinate dehydrogenase [ubiquinone] cytochrome b small subunit n=1 Tax=Asterophora parasitica TaxID=117018 RepID=A0A9P7KAE7_9AGAR|nr:hypothetical protein DXG03_008185 [Asterophora parasitica]